MECVRSFLFFFFFFSLISLKSNYSFQENCILQQSLQDSTFVPFLSLFLSLLLFLLIKWFFYYYYYSCITITIIITDTVKDKKKGNKIREKNIYIRNYSMIWIVKYKEENVSKLIIKIYEIFCFSFHIIKYRQILSIIVRYELWNWRRECYQKIKKIKYEKKGKMKINWRLFFFLYVWCLSIRSGMDKKCWYFSKFFLLTF